MTQEDLDFIKNFQEWRRGAEIPQPHPTEIGIALDKLIKYCEIVSLIKILYIKDL